MMVEISATQRRQGLTLSSLSSQELFMQYWRAVYRCAMEHGVRPDEAERFVHAVMRSASEDESDSSTEQRLRAATETMLHEFASDRSSVFELPIPCGPTVFDSIWQREWRHNLLQLCLERVGSEAEPKNFRAFSLVALQGWTVVATAEYLKMTSGTVRLATSRMLNRVREMVELEAGL